MRSLLSGVLTVWYAFARVEKPLDKVPLHFEPASSKGAFVALGDGMAIALGPDGLRIGPRGVTPITLRFEGSNPVTYAPEDKLPGVSHYYAGNDPSRWRKHVPHYARVRARGLYPGIDAVYYSNGRQIEYDLVVGPGADPSVIRLSFDGAKSITVDPSGDLLLSAAFGSLRQRRPKVYQVAGGRPVEIACSYRIENHHARFSLAKYNRAKPLVIDPVLSYGTLLGGPGDENATGIAVDSSGAILVTGSTTSGFPLRAAADSTSAGTEVFVSKISGAQLVYSTYFGGSGNEYPMSIAVDGSGAAYIGGQTASPDLPLKSALQPAKAPTASFTGYFAKLDTSGALVFSSYLGGSQYDIVNAVRVDGTGIYLGGGTLSPDFPGATSATQPFSAFLVKLNLAGTAPIYTRTLPNAGCSGLAIDSAGAAYLTGADRGVLATPGAYVSANVSNQNAYVAKSHPSGTSWVYVARIGGGGIDDGRGIDVDSAGQAYVTGVTTSMDFPAVNAFDPANATAPTAQLEDAFVFALNAAGSGLVFSTYFGGDQAEFGKSIAVTPAGVWVTGYAPYAAQGVPLKAAWFSSGNNYLARFSLDGRTLVYSTLYPGLGEEQGGLAVDSSGSAYVGGGQSFDSVFGGPTTPGALDETPNGGKDAIVLKFSDAPTVNVTFNSAPQGRRVAIDNVVLTTPATLVWQPGSRHLIDALGEQYDNGIRYASNGWAHAPAVASTPVTAPSVDTVYTANYTASPCPYSISRTSHLFGFEGGFVSLQLDTAYSCGWQVRISDPWITISDMPPGVQGNVFVRVSVTANLGGRSRTGTVTFGTAVFTITQTGFSGTASIGIPAITAPRTGDQPVKAPVLAWTPVAGATGYDIRVLSQTTNKLLLYSGQQSGQNSTSVAVDGIPPRFTMLVRACTNGQFSESSCGLPASADVALADRTYLPEPTIIRPAANQVLTASTNVFEWTPVAGAASYDVWITNQNTDAYRIRTPTPSTVVTLRSSSGYFIRVTACQEVCGGFGNARPFQVQLPPVPSAAPTGLSAQVQGGNSLSVSWTAVAGADVYRVQVVQPNSGPGGGALTVASRQTAATSVTLPVPAGPASVLVQACTGDGCGPLSTPVAINPAGPSPAVPVIATPVPVVNVDGPEILVTWSRIPGDDGTNTTYRLYVGDLANDGPALDVLTRSNFYGAKLQADGTRYDSLVFATQNGTTVVSPPSGFIVAGFSAQAPTVSSPTHNSVFRQGTVRLRWSPVRSGTQYQYYVARQGQSGPALSGIAPGLYVDLVIPAFDNQPTVYQAIVRACRPILAQCSDVSDEGWGVWSQNVTGTTTFTVIP